MPPLEWDKVMSAKAASLSDEQVEEFYEAMVDVSTCKSHLSSMVIQ
jgi:hypothetical protein